MFGISRAEYDEALDRIQDLRERVWVLEQEEERRKAEQGRDEEARDLEAQLLEEGQKASQWAEEAVRLGEQLGLARAKIESLEQSLKDARQNRDEWRQAAKSFDQVARDREKEIRLLQDEIATLEGRLNEARVYRQQQKVEDAAAAVLNAAMIGDQNCIWCLCGDHAAEVRAALVNLQEAIRDA